jgi:hypothetical protein
VQIETAKAIFARYRCIAVKTSIEGGCQIWVITNKTISIQTRHLIQKHFAKKGVSDLGASSGTQFFRCSGFKNHKRDGQWVNLFHKPKKTDPAFNVDEFLSALTKSELHPNLHKVNDTKFVPFTSSKNYSISNAESTASQSEIDWHEVCEKLKSGKEISAVIAELNEKSVKRGKHRAYAARTVCKAARWLGILK